MKLTNIRWILVSTIAALSASAVPALAQEGEGRRGHHDPAAFVKHFDQNGDGRLQLSELPGRMQARLAPGDGNRDGVLGVDELTARWEALKAERHAAMDTDGDGKVSDEERAAFREQKQKEHFAKMDTNGDGQISQAEAGRFWEHLKVADADGSGTVTYAEMTQAIAAGTLKPHGHHRHHEGASDAKS
jgi:Ca2+-binding EF-hand superfamily protein